MSNPFPGMNPYLEEPHSWRDVQLGTICMMRTALNKLMPENYFGRLECRDPKPEIEPAETYIEILNTANSRRVVTRIEILSPDNKIFDYERRKLYLRDQQKMLSSKTHLIEMDLLRAGLHTVAAPEESLPPSSEWNYLACLHRAGKSQYELWLNRLYDRLPRIVVPLDKGVPDVTLDLQAAFNRNYEEAGYHRHIDYTRPPDPSLSEEEAAWADALLREQKLRS